MTTFNEFIRQACAGKGINDIKGHAKGTIIEKFNANMIADELIYIVDKIKLDNTTAENERIISNAALSVFKEATYRNEGIVEELIDYYNMFDAEDIVMAAKARVKGEGIPSYLASVYTTQAIEEFLRQELDSYRVEFDALALIINDVAGKRFIVTRAKDRDDSVVHFITADDIGRIIGSLDSRGVYIMGANGFAKLRGTYAVVRRCDALKNKQGSIVTAIL